MLDHFHLKEHFGPPCHDLHSSSAGSLLLAQGWTRNLSLPSPPLNSIALYADCIFMTILGPLPWCWQVVDRDDNSNQ